MECYYFNPYEIYVSLVAHWPHSTFHRWLETDAYLRLDVAVGVGDDHLVTCHSAEHPAGFRPTRAASPLPAEIEELEARLRRRDRASGRPRLRRRDEHG